jgi:UDP-N-acetylglucosamine--N-acetylmuramyl-(pentapeptide) pyrophosphoryl-undecaprenol N-acetylglucosamine transferase
MTAVRSFVMAGGGTGGHVMPAIAVARILRDRGYEVLFLGTERGMEAKLVPAAGFPIEWIEIGGLKGLGRGRQLKTLWQMPNAARRVREMFGRHRPSAVFSMGGYVAGPVAAAAIWSRVPLVVMEPNAMPGASNRYIGRFVAKALLSFPEAARWFPRDRTEITGVPVRSEFFTIAPKPQTECLTILITGGSQGSRTLNRAAVESWALFRQAGLPIRILHQTGVDAFEGIRNDFAGTGLAGEVMPFIADMPAAFAEADVIVCRSGASAVSEVAAAGKASILVPYPFAADNHQLRNAEALARAGAAKLVLDSEMNGRRLVDEVLSLSRTDEIANLGERARKFARPMAAERAADILQGLAGKRTN